MSHLFNNLSFKSLKQNGEPITMVTAYDYTSAYLCAKAGIDTLLVGDSLGMVMLGYDDTLQVTMSDMIHHTQAVRRGAPQSFIIADMPYLSYHISVEKSVESAGKLIANGRANAVKIEGGREFLPVIEAIIHAQIPIIGHLGLTPQSVNAFGGYRVQAKQEQAAKKLYQDALALQGAGVSAIVLECVPPNIANWVSKALDIPTIGIGAGADCDGQVLVFHDMLGLYDKLEPKFVKRYANVAETMLSGLKNYHEEVKSKKFPQAKHAFKASDIALDKLY